MAKKPKVEFVVSGVGALAHSLPQLIKMEQAAQITGLPLSLLKKSFMKEEKRPQNIPSPPPHKRIGRSVYIITEQLSQWVRSIGVPTSSNEGKRRRGRPTVAERIARREQSPHAE